MHILACFKVPTILNACLYLYFLLRYSKILRKASQKITRNKSERRKTLLALEYCMRVLKMKMLSLHKNLQWY